MELGYILLATQLIQQIGITFGVGASTFALIFFIASLRDGIMDPSEKTFMKIVFVVLRIGMVLIGVSLISFACILYFTGNAALLYSSAYIMEWIILAVITINAILMTKHIMPMSIGPVLAGGSWYSFFLLTALPLGSLSLIAMGLYYLAFLVIFYIVFTLVKGRFSGAPTRV